MSEERDELDQWLEENKERIDRVSLAAAFKIDGVAEMLTDPSAEGEDVKKQKITALITASHGVLPEFIGEAFVEEFSEYEEPFLTVVKDTFILATREHIPRFIDEIILIFAKTQR